MAKLEFDPFDSHLDFCIGSDGLTATAMHKDGFQYLWKGCRTNFGVTSGKYMYEVRILSNLPVEMPGQVKAHKNLLRVGFSQPLTSLFLGDTDTSWGFGGTGTKSHNDQYLPYGEKFSVGDVIGVIIDFGKMEISYTKNGMYLGVAYKDLPAICREVGIFPHVMLKNVKVECNFARSEKMFDPPSSDILFFNEATHKHLVINPIDHPQSKDDCEFIQMVGLPASGKTYWAEEHMKADPKKGFLLLGTNAVIDQMKVAGLRRNRAYAQRWNELIQQAMPIFEKMVEMASRTQRNFILDQTNVFPNARVRKLNHFLEFGTRRCVVVVNTSETLARRTCQTREKDGKFVPDHVISKFKANFKAPDVIEGFTKVEWAELQEYSAKEQILLCNQEGKGFQSRHSGANKSRNNYASKGKGGKGGKGKGNNSKTKKAPHYGFPFRGFGA